MTAHPVPHQNAAVIRRPAKIAKPARIVLALGNAPQQRLIQEMFQANGWEVLVVHSPDEARRWARKSRTVATLLVDEPAKHESGWLTCAKLLAEKPKHRVVILGTKATPQAERLAAFVGAAAYLPPGASELAIARAVMG